MIGLKRGTVELISHQATWERNATKIILLLKSILREAAIDIQHVGSTAIKSICAKPIIDIAVGMENVNDINPYIELLSGKGVIFRKEDVSGQLLFVIGVFETDIITHHIHVVKWGSDAWNNYVNFRDYLNTFPEYAKEYDSLKKELALNFSDDRGSYTLGKQVLISRLLEQAYLWRTENK
ncbi:MAG: GrpB family protein [Clostridia bacterium]|nr:GrpB family protein [Clostridia bacterium]